MVGLAAALRAGALTADTVALEARKAADDTTDDNLTNAATDVWDSTTDTGAPASAPGPISPDVDAGDVADRAPARAAAPRHPAAAVRQLYPPEDHPFLSRMYAAGLRGIVTLRGPGSRASHLADLLLAQSEEFRRGWDDHEIGIRPNDVKRFIHPELGALELNCQRLLDPQQSHYLLVYTAVPGSESYDKLQLLSVIGSQTVRSNR